MDRVKEARKAELAWTRHQVTGTCAPSCFLTVRWMAFHHPPPEPGPRKGTWFFMVERPQNDSPHVEAPGLDPEMTRLAQTSRP